MPGASDVVTRGSSTDEPAGDLERLRAAGLYDPASPTASEREELLRYLLGRFSADDVVHWAQHTNLFGVAARAIDRPPPFISAVDVANRAGVELDVVTQFRSALGFPVVDPEARALPATATADVQTFLLGCDLYGRDEALAFTRVLGWAATRVMEAARAMFGAGVVRMDEDARTELELAKTNEAAIVAWTQVQAVMLHVLAEHPFRNRRFAEALMRGELQLALAFVDLVESTAWAESVGLAEHSDALRRFEMRSSAIAGAHGARLVKLIGDEAMLVGDDPAALCGAALDICDVAGADPDLPDARGAVGYGTVTARDGDYFGPVVNVVARASKCARPGGIVVDEAVARRLDADVWSTVSVGLEELRGVGEHVHLRVAARRGDQLPTSP